MNDYIVLYRDETVLCPADPPFAFRCQGDDPEHAEEQCLNAYPETDIVWVYQGKNQFDALREYWNTEAA